MHPHRSDPTALQLRRVGLDALSEVHFKHQKEIQRFHLNPAQPPPYFNFELGLAMGMANPEGMDQAQRWHLHALAKIGSDLEDPLRDPDTRRTAHGLVDNARVLRTLDTQFTNLLKGVKNRIS